MIVKPNRDVIYILPRWRFLQEPSGEKVLVNHPHQRMRHDEVVEVDFGLLANHSRSALVARLIKIAGETINPIVNALAPERAVAEVDQEIGTRMEIQSWNYVNCIDRAIEIGLSEILPSRIDGEKATEMSVVWIAITACHVRSQADTWCFTYVVKGVAIV